MLVKYTF